MEFGTPVLAEKEEQKQQQQEKIYLSTYWVRKFTQDAAPLPDPQTLSSQDCRSGAATTISSA